MDRLLKIFLKNYDPQEKEIFMTARFVMITIICVISTTVATIVCSVWLDGLDSIILFPQGFGLIVMLGALGLLIKGNYKIAAHAIFIAAFTTIWMVLFMNSSRSMITKMDTIVFVIGLLAAMPMVLSENRKPIFAYFFFNIAMFLIFNYHLKGLGLLSIKEHLGYLVDILAA